jgi:hypothetical protein
MADTGGTSGSPTSVASNLEYLIPYIRIQIGDLTAPYRYTDSMILTVIKASIKALQRWWNNRYLLDSSENVYRNPGITFLMPSPPIIQDADQRPIELMSSIIIKTGSLENVSYSLSSWRDAEISFSNLEMGRRKDASLVRDWNELTSLLSIPVKRLAWTIKGSLPGYNHNPYEKDSEY